MGDPLYADRQANRLVDKKKVSQYDDNSPAHQQEKLLQNVLGENVDGEKARIPYGELTCVGKMKFTALIALKLLVLVATLYFFMCSIKILNAAFILIGGRQASAALGKDSVLTHPMCGMMVGVFSTAILNSSSTTTSICVILVASNIFTIPIAIPIVMGANIGTSVSSTMVALMHAGDRKQFRDAFSAATVHDMFNWLSVIVLLPLELLTGYLYRLTGLIVNSTTATGGGTRVRFVSVLTEPFANLIVQTDKKVVEKIISGEPGMDNIPILKYWCKTKSVLANTTEMAQNATTEIIEYSDVTTPELSTPQPTMIIGIKPCWYIFHGTHLTEPAVGGIILVISFVMLIVCLIIMVKTLKSLLAGSLAKVIHKTINANFPGKFACLTGYFAIIVGMVVTILIQTSVVTTAALTSLVGLQMVTVDRVFPMTLGANIGTTSTAILAAFATSSIKFKAALQMALCHLFFNISGILMWYPVPFMRAVPLGLAKFLGRTTAKYRWFAIFYLLFMFVFLPVFLLVISWPGLHVLLGVGIPIIVFLITIGVINLMQNKCPQCLPRCMRTWHFLPEPLRSLEPYDRVISKLIGYCSCCECCRNLHNDYSDDDVKQLEGDGGKKPETDVKIEMVNGVNGHLQNKTRL